MEERKPKKSEHFIEPGSKEDREATKALNEVFDVISKQSKERYRLEKEAAEMERERRIGEGLPLGDDCYFARLASLLGGLP